MFRNHIDGTLYIGDMQRGDREATPEEITAWQTLTPYQEEEIKRKLLAEAVPKRDSLLFHLERFRVRAVEELAAAVGQPAIDAATAKKQAIDAAIAGLEGMFNDPRVVGAIDGAVTAAVKQVYLETFAALYSASPAAYLALKALDPL